MAEAAAERPARVVYCGDRVVGRRIAEHLRAAGDEVVALGLNSPPRPQHREIRAACDVDPGMVFYGRSLLTEVAARKLARAAPDIGVCCGFAPILPPSLLALPAWGWVNLHRSYLPYNRGLDPLQWALIDGTPAGVSLHVMTEEVDAGPVVAQTEIPVLPTDDGASLEVRADAAALELFAASWPMLRRGRVDATPQDHDLATMHTAADCESARHLDLGASMNVGRLLRLLRAYSSAPGAGAWFTTGLLRARFSVHAQVVMVDQPAPAPSEPSGTTAPGAGPGHSNGGGPDNGHTWPPRQVHTLGETT